MNDYDVFIVPNFVLDSNYNYEIKFVIDKNYNNTALFDKFRELYITEDVYFSSYNKCLYSCNLSCLVNLVKWLNELNDEFKLIKIKSNLDIVLATRHK